MRGDRHSPSHDRRRSDPLRLLLRDGNPSRSGRFPPDIPSRQSGRVPENVERPLLCGGAPAATRSARGDKPRVGATLGRGGMGVDGTGSSGVRAAPARRSRSIRPPPAPRPRPRAETPCPNGRSPGVAVRAAARASARKSRPTANGGSPRQTPFRTHGLRARSGRCPRPEDAVSLPQPNARRRDLSA